MAPGTGEAWAWPGLPCCLPTAAPLLTGTGPTLLLVPDSLPETQPLPEWVFSCHSSNVSEWQAFSVFVKKSSSPFFKSLPEDIFLLI